MHSNPVPLPVTKQVRTAMRTRKKLHPVQVQIDKQLFDAAQREAKAQKRTVKEVVDWAFREFLFVSNPNVAAQLGIHADAKVANAE